MKLDFSKVGKMQEAPVGAMGGVPGTRFFFSNATDGAGFQPVLASEVIREEMEKNRSGAVLDFNQARDLITAFDAEIDEMIAEAEAFVVDSDESAREATERAGAVKGLVKRIEDRRKEIIAELDGFTRKVNQAVKPRRDKLETVERVFKRKIGDYSYRIELERREILRKQEEERVRLQAQIDAEAKAKGVESLQVAPVALPAKQGPTRSESATASLVMVWDFEIVDAKEIPRPYLTVDDHAIRAAIKAGIREIPGVRVFERAEVRVRRVG